MVDDSDKPRIETNDPSLALIVRRLVEALHPEQIYLFGSHARGEVLLSRRSNFEGRQHLRASFSVTIEGEGKILYAA